ncbi:MAG: hypothetical protein IT562_23600 [Alphaproteobacteria bacterium]|nr:hypothetical protein [Alphaproteobacteria bacterium]
MAVGGVGSISAFQVQAAPQATPQAKAAEEQSESAAVKASEGATDKEKAAASTTPSNRLVDIKV